MTSLLKLFCDVDDFCQWVQQQQLPAGGRRVRQPGLCASEIMTIMIHFHQSGYRNFKSYYTYHVQCHLRNAFPELVSYSRFISLLPRVAPLLWAYAQARCGGCTGLGWFYGFKLHLIVNELGEVLAFTLTPGNMMYPINRTVK